MYKQLMEAVKEADMVLIGMGEELFQGLLAQEKLEVMNQLEKLLDHHNYFIVVTANDEILRNSQLNQKRIVYPYLSEESEEEKKQWELYNKWLSATLAKKLLMIELGEGFMNPNLIRWPFERVTMINQKAKLYRVHSELWQIPQEIGEKAFSIEKDSSEFLKEWLQYCEL